MSYKQQRKRKTPQHQLFLPGKPVDKSKHNCRYCNNMQSLDNGEGGMAALFPQSKGTIQKMILLMEENVLHLLRDYDELQERFRKTLSE